MLDTQSASRPLDGSSDFALVSQEGSDPYRLLRASFSKGLQNFLEELFCFLEGVGRLLRVISFKLNQLYQFGEVFLGGLFRFQDRSS